MKYYAVTEDPNELLHYGRLGMKWGQHIFVGSKSLAYKNAIGKLRNSKNNTIKSSVKNTVNNVKSAIKKSRAQHAINKQRRQEHKFNNAVEKAQRRIALTENYNVADKLNNYAKAASQANRREQKISKIESKKDRKYFRNEKKMDKYMQEAREGRLRYGKLSDEQVDRITQRLAIERSARQLGNTEKASFRKRLKEATQEGILQGVTQGTAAGMREVAIDKVQNRLRNKRVMDKANRNDAERVKEATRIKNKRTHKEMREDFRRDAYEERIKEGDILFTHPFTKRAANKLKKIEDNREEQKFLLEESHNERRNARQDRENEAREERKLMRQGELGYLYGIGLNSGDNSGGSNNSNGQKKKNKGGNNSSYSTDDAIKYYKQKIKENNADLIAQRQELALINKERAEKKAENQRRKEERAAEIKRWAAAYEQNKEARRVSREQNSKPIVLPTTGSNFIGNTERGNKQRQTPISEYFTDTAVDSRVENARKNTSVKKQNRKKNRK